MIIHPALFYSAGVKGLVEKMNQDDNKIDYSTYLSELRGFRISILIDGLRKKESYSGVVWKTGKDYLVLLLNTEFDEDRKYQLIAIRYDQILSMLMYNDSLESYDKNLAIIANPKIES